MQLGFKHKTEAGDTNSGQPTYSGNETVDIANGQGQIEKQAHTGDQGTLYIYSASTTAKCPQKKQLKWSWGKSEFQRQWKALVND